MDIEPGQTLVTVSLMGAAGIVGVPIIIAAGAFCAAPFVFDWAYDKFIAKKFNDEANKFYNSMKNKFKILEIITHIVL